MFSDNWRATLSLGSRDSAGFPVCAHGLKEVGEKEGQEEVDKEEDGKEYVPILFNHCSMNFQLNVAKSNS